MIEIDQAIRANCTRVLSHHHQAAPADLLRALASHEAAADPADSYGDGGAIARLEARVTPLLNKESGLFFIKGVAAQLSVLSAYAAQRGCRAVALPRLSHLEVDEQDAITRVAHLVPVRLGRDAPFTVEALERIPEPLAAVVVELPLRRAGYLLPDLGALREMSGWCRDRGVPLHLDGARLWEAAAGYGVSLADLSDLADSVYVSFYKGLGGLGGALVAGPAPFLAALKPWKTRFGGDLYTAYPQAIAALIGLDRQLPRMPEYVARARALAARLADLPAFLVQPRRPDVNAFQLWMRGDPADLAVRHRAFAEQRCVWLFNGFQPTALASHAMAEIVIGDASDDYSIAEAIDWLIDFAAVAATPRNGMAS